MSNILLNSCAESSDLKEGGDALTPELKKRIPLRSTDSKWVHKETAM